MKEPWVIRESWFDRRHMTWKIHHWRSYVQFLEIPSTRPRILYFCPCTFSSMIIFLERSMLKYLIETFTINLLFISTMVVHTSQVFYILESRHLNSKLGINFLIKRKILFDYQRPFYKLVDSKLHVHIVSAMLITNLQNYW